MKSIQPLLLRSCLPLWPILPTVLKEPPPSVSILAFTEHGITYDLDFYVADYADAPLARSDAFCRIWVRAAERGVAIARPRQEIIFNQPGSARSATTPPVAVGREPLRPV